MDLDFHENPAEFLDAAGGYLAAEPVISTVLSTIADRAVRELADGVAQHPRNWYAVARDGSGRVIGAAMRTAPFAPHPLFVLPMPVETAVELARAVHARGEAAGGVNGALPAARACADELARLEGGTVVESMRTRLFHLPELIEPAPVGGRLRLAREDEIDLCFEWFEAFRRDADAQAGRKAGHDDLGLTRDDMLRRIRGGLISLWEDASGEVVHLTGANAPAFGVARIGPVYTPARYRGRGSAGAAVAQVSREMLAAGVQPCLYADQANPVSNLIYERLGFRPLVDMVNLSVTTTGPTKSERA